MGQALMVPPAGFDELTVEEKIEYVEALWERIAKHPERVPVPQSHRDALAIRMEASREGRDESRPWPEVRAEIHAALRKLSR